MDAVSRNAWEMGLALARAEAEMQKATKQTQRTRYAIRMGGLYVGQSGDGHHWAQTADAALAFGSMTAANGHAVMELGMGPNEYTIEAV